MYALWLTDIASTKCTDFDFILTKMYERWLTDDIATKCIDFGLLTDK